MRALPRNRPYIHSVDIRALPRKRPYIRSADVCALLRKRAPPSDAISVRAFAWFLGSILLAGLIGASIAYPAYELTSTFANWAFHRVASRIAMLVLVAELVWLCRHLNLRTKHDCGY